MAEGFLKSFDNSLNVYSAGIMPDSKVHPKTIQVMEEVGVDVSEKVPLNAELYLDKDFDYIVTVCSRAKFNIPEFKGKIKKRLHIAFPDPTKNKGSENEIVSTFRRVRDWIHDDFYNFYCEVMGKEPDGV